ncbi:hypothetical protein [Azospirillum humicireducens]|uniref:hypothetical protein n=1 Tax=Azospirillum humicireducens TaxID=1226968 RepID=UPI00130497C6|nr:hypothetical protein [Azospirillum humicireducens]
MFDFDVVTGPTQPPHCPLADEPDASESAQPAAVQAAAAAAHTAPNAGMEGKPRS